MYLKYQPLVDYLSTHTPWRFQLDLSSTYQETIDRLCGGQVDLAYLGPFSYVRAHEVCGARPIVRLNTGGRESYTSYIMVRQDSGITTLAQLKGQRIAFGARLSTSSHLVPRAMLDRAGLRLGVDVTCSYHGHHDRAARAVLLGETAACGIRDLVGDQFKTRGLKVLAQSDPIPNFPLVVGPGAPPELAAALADVLIDLPGRDPAAAATIAGWDAELAGGFAPVGPEAYAPVLDLARRVFGPRAPFLPPEELVCRPGSRIAGPPTSR
jgi:phosphonate transport system substrate-binding protein